VTSASARTKMESAKYTMQDSESQRPFITCSTTTGMCLEFTTDNDPVKVHANFCNRRRNAFTSLDPREHGFRRRRTAALYSKTSLLGSVQMHNISIKVMFDRLVPRLSTAAAKGTGMDALELSYCLCSDYISSFLFGYRNGTNYLAKDDQTSINEWRLHYENHMCDEGFFPQEMPVVSSLLKNIGIDVLPESYRGSKKFLEKWMGDMAVRADETMRHHEVIGLPIAPEDQPIVYGTAKSAVEKDSPHLDTKAKRDEVASEMFDHICTSPYPPQT
jgi:hypothetical protein